MSENALREAIAKPAELAEHPLDLSTIDLLIEQTEGREGALPLLQFALAQIWVGLAAGKEPAETLRAIGGVGGALAGEAQRIYEGLVFDEQEIARRFFLGLVQLGEETKVTRRRTKLEQIVAHRDNLENVQKVIDRFADARLITLADKDGTETAEVTHEALFDNWKQLKDWLDAGRSDLRFQRRLDDAVMIWQDNGRPEGNLWRSPDLDLLRGYQERTGDNMTPRQLDFSNASERAEFNRKRVGQFIRAGGITAFLLVMGFAGVAIYQLRQAQCQQLEQFAARARELMTSNQTVDATINAIAATGLSQSALVQFPNHPQFASVDGSLRDVVSVNLEQNQLPHNDQVFSVAFRSDGQRIVSGSTDKTVRLWDAKTGAQIGKPLTDHENWVTSVAFSPDGQRIISSSTDKTMRLWDAKTGTQIGKPLTGHADRVWDAVFSPDGQHIISGSGKKVWRWDAKTGSQIGKPLTGHESLVGSVAFSPDGQRFISGSLDKTVRLWDAKTGTPIGNSLIGHTDEVYSVVFSPDGQRIVSSGRDKTLRLWDISWKSLLPKACNQLRYHPSLNQPTTDVAREAKQTCENFVWKK
jgi:WD40 repeat protein